MPDDVTFLLGPWSLVLTCSLSACNGGDPSFPSKVDCEASEIECFPRLVITAGAACSGQVGGVPASCFVVDGNGAITNTNNIDELEDFTCLQGDPCAMATGAEFCAAAYPVDAFTPDEEAVGVGSADSVCLTDAALAASLQLYDTRTYDDVADYIEDEVELSCNAYFDVLVKAACDEDFTEAEILDTGFEAAAPEELEAVYVPDLIFHIDPATSSLSIEGSNQVVDTTPLNGALYAIGSPTRFAMGVAFGGRITVEGTEVKKTWGMFNVTMNVDASSGTFSVSAEDLQGISWWGRNAANDAVITFSSTPTEAVTGTFDLQEGEWSLSFEEEVGSRTVQIEMSGMLQSAI